MMAVTIFGYERLLSLGMAYGIDCYKPQAPYVAAALTLLSPAIWIHRQLLAHPMDHSFWLLELLFRAGCCGFSLQLWPNRALSLMALGPNKRLRWDGLLK
jgi:hypothetical protein